MHTDMLSTSASLSLAGAMQDHASTVCPWCKGAFESGMGFGIFCCKGCADAEVSADAGPALRSAHQVEQDRRQSSIALCVICKHAEKAHGSHTGACLQKIGGRFDGALDQTRCRCKQFIAVDETKSDTPHDALLRSLVLAQGKKLTKMTAEVERLKEQVSGLLARETV